MKTCSIILSVVFSITSVYGSGVEKVFARATKYHKTDKNCDHNTAKGLTSTKIKLEESCQKTIGVVAVDPDIIPYGSLVYSPDTKRLFLACDIGGAVTSRDAAKGLASSNKQRNAIVVDVYSPREILDNHYGYFYVIKYDGEKPFFRLYKEYQEKRLDPRFWIEKINQKETNSKLEEIERALQLVLSSS